MALQKTKSNSFIVKIAIKRCIDFYCYKAYKLTTNAKKISNPIFYKKKSYEVDEIRCYLKRKTKRVVSFSLGRRTKRTIQYVTNSLALPKSIYTDGLFHYRSLIVKALHKVNRFGTNVIERNNLSMRTHLKRLQRKTICFSGSFILLQCVLRIYFWVEKLYSSQEYFL
ncbi:IS1 family transposase [Flavobacterium sediminilitoris]|uniref:IS1 family transposase n=1 Tax=Flavobacterium sediminilitoris TaxID=2024526 RepID=A0ABY4HPL6_9FLAO|nr:MULTISPECIES: IS1 family transposase [Flavobacterium]UOX34826.1 IS1 family transposase [Flavobacterium sediminilitoris]